MADAAEETKAGGSIGTEVELRPFRAGDGEAFRLLNEAWIEKHFGLEAKDRETLNDPEHQILAKGGHIFMAVDGERAVGCCALLLVQSGMFEVAKMTVAEGQRGRGLGRKILAYTIAQGKALGAASLYLETNDKLLDAIHLYEELGFRHLPPERVTPSPYARANVSMELVF
jgi:N-acetylglutamate synthase-like GNAT family acetyltransferase